MKKKTPKTKTTKPKANVPRQEIVKAGLYFTGAGIAQLSDPLDVDGTRWGGYLWRPGTSDTSDVIPIPLYCQWRTDLGGTALGMCTYGRDEVTGANDYDLMDRCPSENLGAMLAGFNPRKFAYVKKPKPEPTWLPWIKSDEIPFYMVEYRSIQDHRNIHKPIGLSVDDDNNPLLLHLDSAWYTPVELLELWEYRQFDPTTGYSDWEKCGNLQTTKPLF